ncbi:DNA-binding protein [Anaerophilus nitritogenes]|uniref:DNA-binding protein n=1 Tax=Anaerophilus nitritogenes TaxID=2498136 RepID=UPI00101D879C|nr:DNA-binding protein [Anaerophilus nitritogenes]
MLSPQQFARECDLSYGQVLQMCKEDELDVLKTEGGHFKIPEKELDRFRNRDYITKEEYLRVVRENEKLKTIITQMKNYISSFNVE